jgi:tripartite-type tricarboxylate transporter receptor subunit TctC
LKLWIAPLIRAFPPGHSVANKSPVNTGNAAAEGRNRNGSQTCGWLANRAWCRAKTDRATLLNKPRNKGDTMKRYWSAALCAIAFAVAGTPAQAQNYPDRPITIVVPLAAGSGMDSLVRLYADRLQASLGKPVIVENKPGASLMLAAAHVATSPADGYTLLVSTSSAMAINLTLFKKVNYDAARDFVPISYYVKSPFILVVNPDLPAKTVPELIELAKKSNPPLSYSSPGAGVAQHLSMEYMKQRFGLNMAHVPYRNTPQSITDIVAGHVQLGFAEAGASLPLIQDGRLRALAVTSLTRLPALPDVPPFAEAAGVADFELVSWHVLFAKAATPGDIVNRLHGEIARIMSDPELRQAIENHGLIPQATQSIEVTKAYIASENDKWGALVRSLGLAGSI